MELHFGMIGMSALPWCIAEGLLVERSGHYWLYWYYFGPNPLKGTLNGSFLHPSTTKIPVAWNLYPLFTTLIFSLKWNIYSIERRQHQKKIGYSFVQLPFWAEIFYGCNKSCGDLFKPKKPHMRATFISKIFQELLKCWMDVGQGGSDALAWYSSAAK